VIAEASAAELQAYGVFLASRYARGNVIWCLGGDRDEPLLLEKQWNIVSGFRSVRTTDLVSAHPLADQVNADDA